jgi:hypothetical protein
MVSSRRGSIDHGAWTMSLSLKSTSKTVRTFDPIKNASIDEAEEAQELKIEHERTPQL